MIENGAVLGGAARRGAGGGMMEPSLSSLLPAVLGTAARQDNIVSDGALPGATGAPETDATACGRSPFRSTAFAPSFLAAAKAGRGTLELVHSKTESCRTVVVECLLLGAMSLIPCCTSLPPSLHLTSAPNLQADLQRALTWCAVAGTTVI